ncbi:hypothetical protein BBP40_011896, partial [Aspergillus hancockii]
MTRFTTLTILSLLTLTPSSTLAAPSASTACYSNPGPTLSATRTSKFQSVALCQETCSENNKPVSAVQGQTCLCGDTLPPPETLVPNSKCSTRCPGYPDDSCGGPTTWTVTSFSGAEHDEDNGIVTAPDNESDPFASLSVNPTMVETATPTVTGTKTSVPSGILTAPAASSGVITSASGSASASASASPSVTPSSG